MSINRDVSLSEKKRAYVIYTCGMVCVLMGEEDSVQPFDVLPEHLLPEIGTAIDHVIVIIPGDHHRNTQPFVLWIFTEADRVITPDHGDALRGSGTQKSQFQRLVYFIQIYDLFI